MADKKYKCALDKILSEEFCEKHMDEYLNSKCDKGFRFFDSFIESMKLFEEKFSERRIVAGSLDAYTKYSQFYFMCLKYFGNEKF